MDHTDKCLNDLQCCDCAIELNTSDKIECHFKNITTQELDKNLVEAGYMKSTLPVFLKYYHKFAYGNNEIKYKYLGKVDDIDSIDKDLLEDVLSNIVDAYSYSGKYRGIDYEVIDNPPKEWLTNEIECNVEEIENLRRKNAIFQSILLKDIGKTTNV
jgi:hypothetical protein